MTVRHIALGFLFLNNFILRTSEFILKGSKTLNHKIQSMTILVTLVKGLWGKWTEKKGITKIHCWVCKIHLTWTYSGGGERRKGIQWPPGLDVLPAQVASEWPLCLYKRNCPSPSRHSPTSVHSPPASPALKKRKSNIMQLPVSLRLKLGIL